MTEEAKARLHRAWVVLDSPVRKELSSFLLQDVTSAAGVRAAVDTQGRRHLLLPHQDAPAVLVDGPKSVLTTSSRLLTFDGVPVTYVDVVCHDPSLHREFDQICLDILDEYSDDGPESGAAVAAQVVGRWRRLLRTVRNRGLSPEEKTGLFAELCVFRSLAATNRAAAENWTGPDKRPHDFEFASMSLEVKALGENADDVVVHGLGQLDEFEAKPLYLILGDVRQDETGERLVDVAAEIESMLAVRNGFRAKLNMVGISDEDESRYLLESLHLGRVTKDFPRLVVGDLVRGVPAGLSRVSYHVDRGALMPFLQSVELADIPGFIS